MAEATLEFRSWEAGYRYERRANAPREGGETMKVVIALGLVLIASVALAGPPVSGTYKSVSLSGGTFLDGRFSESYAGGAQGAEGNVVHVASYDEDTGFLGTEWYISCPTLLGTPEIISDTRVNGTGFVTYRTTYSGGMIWLADIGPWGDEDYTGAIDYYTHETQFLYVAGTPQGYTTNATVDGTIDGYCECFEIIANAASGGSGVLPTGYPAYLDGDCVPDLDLAGEYGPAYEITITLHECPSGTSPAEWGSIKALYK
jgi:hypothetical protein